MSEYGERYDKAKAKVTETHVAWIEAKKELRRAANEWAKENAELSCGQRVIYRGQLWAITRAVTGTWGALSVHYEIVRVLKDGKIGSKTAIISNDWDEFKCIKE